MRVRFDLDLLDPEDPFEIDDGNRPHLFEHLPSEGGRYVSVGPSDIMDLYVAGDPLYFEGREDGAADWIMIGIVPGLMLLSPLSAA